VNAFLPPSLLSSFPQLLQERTVILSNDSKNSIIVAEFHGALVDDIRKLRQSLSTLTGLPVVLMREGWLPHNPDGKIDISMAQVKLGELQKRQNSVDSIEDGSFSVIQDTQKDCFEYFGSYSKVRTPVELTYPAHITLGNWVSLGRYGKVVMLPNEVFERGGEELIQQHYPHIAGTFNYSNYKEDRPAKLYLGDGTTLGDRYFIICTKSVEFGRHVMTASNLFVSDCHHIYEHTEIPPALLPVTTGKPVIIEDHVWIGVNCCILEGVTVGRHAVVAANSVVKDDVPPYSLVAGTPARVKKTFGPNETRSIF
jgi:acetyltransferase-like isoleucine patch superfamily enzyme